MPNKPLKVKQVIIYDKLPYLCSIIYEKLPYLCSIIYEKLPYLCSIIYEKLPFLCSIIYQKLPYLCSIIYEKLPYLCSIIYGKLPYLPSLKCISCNLPYFCSLECILPYLCAKECTTLFPFPTDSPTSVLYSIQTVLPLFCSPYRQSYLCFVVPTDSPTSVLQSIQTVLPLFCRTNSRVYEEIQKGEGKDGPQLRGEQRMEAVHNCCVPETKIQNIKLTGADTGVNLGAMTQPWKIAPL